MGHDRSVGRFLKKKRISSRIATATGLTSKPDPDFDTKCADNCGLYQAAPAVAEPGVQTVSIDEMTGIQALEHAAPSLPMKSGHVERREFEYIRHGTKALIAAIDVASGKVRGSIGDTRTEADFVSFLDNLFAWRHRRHRGRSSATISTPTCPRGWSAWWRTFAASTKIWVRKENPASSSRW